MSDLRTWAELSAEASTNLKAVQEKGAEYVANLTSLDEYGKSMERAIDVLAAITRRMQDNPPNTLAGEDKRAAVKAAFTALFGLKIIDRVHPDLWELREELSVKYLKAHGVDMNNDSDGL